MNGYLNVKNQIRVAPKRRNNGAAQGLGAYVLLASSIGSRFKAQFAVLYDACLIRRELRKELNKEANQ